MRKELVALSVAAVVLAMFTAGCSRTTTKAVETPGAKAAGGGAAPEAGQPAAGEAAGTASTPASAGVEQSSVTAPGQAASAQGAPGAATPDGAAPGQTTPAGAVPGQATPAGGEATGNKTEAVVTPPMMLASAAGLPLVAPAGTPSAGNSYDLLTIYFDFDKSNIRPDAKSTLDTNFDILSKNASAKVMIVGHCDERGSNEYNMALGDRRAASTRSYLINRGIGASRLSTLSKGEEEPVDPGHNETAWAKNRRAQFVGQ